MERLWSSYRGNDEACRYNVDGDEVVHGSIGTVEAKVMRKQERVGPETGEHQPDKREKKQKQKEKAAH